MSDISDSVSQKLYKPTLSHREVMRLRYASDYGHGFLGLFKALAEGNLERLIRDPGPPYIDEKHIKAVMANLLSLARGSKFKDKIHPKYADVLKDHKKTDISRDTLFE